MYAYFFNRKELIQINLTFVKHSLRVKVFDLKLNEVVGVLVRLEHVYYNTRNKSVLTFYTL